MSITDLRVAFETETTMCVEKDEIRGENLIKKCNDIQGVPFEIMHTNLFSHCIPKCSLKPSNFI